jgi:DNA-binding MarR family transcriptional regulator
MQERDEAEDLPLGHWIKRAYLAMTGHLNDLLRPYDLTYSQWQVLSYVARHLDGAATQKELQCWLKVEAATLTGVIDGLERRGWLTRAESTDDRRVKQLALTPAGQAAYAAVSPWLSPAVQARVLEGLSPGQVTVAREVLQRVVENLVRRQAPDPESEEPKVFIPTEQAGA